METSQLRHIISSGIEGLPVESLKEIADFVVFVRLRSSKPLVFEKQDDLAIELSRELALLDSYELLHLQEEFSGYEIAYPHE
jgi:hypothetical protein